MAAGYSDPAKPRCASSVIFQKGIRGRRCNGSAGMRWRIRTTCCSLANYALRSMPKKTTADAPPNQRRRLGAALAPGRRQTNPRHNAGWLGGAQRSNPSRRLSHWRQTLSPARSMPLTSSSCIRLQPNSNKRCSTSSASTPLLVRSSWRAWPKSCIGSVHYGAHRGKFRLTEAYRCRRE
jgi:hypothetical protein